MGGFAVRTGRLSPGLGDLIAYNQLDSVERAFAERIAFDKYPERFVARLPKPHRDILTMLLINDFPLSRLAFMGKRDPDAIIAGIKEALASVEKTHA